MFSWRIKDKMCGATELNPNRAPQEKIGTFLSARFDGYCKISIVILRYVIFQNWKRWSVVRIHQGVGVMLIRIKLSPEILEMQKQP